MSRAEFEADCNLRVKVDGGCNADARPPATNALLPNYVYRKTVSEPL